MSPYSLFWGFQHFHSLPRLVCSLLLSSQALYFNQLLSKLENSRWFSIIFLPSQFGLQRWDHVWGFQISTNPHTGNFSIPSVIEQEEYDHFDFKRAKAHSRIKSGQEMCSKTEAWISTISTSNKHDLLQCTLPHWMENMKKDEWENWHVWISAFNQYMVRE